MLTLGRRRWFEYHCWESPESADSELWYRSHQRVTIVALEAIEDGAEKLTMVQRLDGGIPAVYRVRFNDGYQGSVFEDELLCWRSEFQRPTPPMKGS